MPKFLMSTLFACFLMLTALWIAPSLAHACPNATMYFDQDVIAANAIGWHIDRQEYDKVFDMALKEFPQLRKTMGMVTLEELAKAERAHTSRERRILGRVASAIVRTKGEMPLGEGLFQTPQERTRWATQMLEALSEKSRRERIYLAEALVLTEPERHDEAFEILQAASKNGSLNSGSAALAYSTLLAARKEEALAKRMQTEANRLLRKEQKSRRPSESVRYSTKPYKDGSYHVPVRTKGGDIELRHIKTRQR